jgi:hypothetical protein
MAFSLADLCLVHRLKTQGYLPNGSAVVEIGAQQIDDSILANMQELEVLGRAFGVDSPCPPFAAGPASHKHRLAGAPMARDIWTWLGTEYAAIDIERCPGSIPLDLNCDEVPTDARSKYRLVTNLGTTEHVANQLHAFKIIHDLTAADGVMIHNVPCHWLGHGLVGYNPKFFFALARSNNYEILYMDLSFADEADFSDQPDPVVSDISRFVPDFPERWRRYRPALCILHVAMQKQYDLEYVAPLDVDNIASIDDAVLKNRYWTVFDRGAFETIALSRAKALEDAEQKATKREAFTRTRELAVYKREQAAAAAEADIEHRKRAVFEREQAGAAAEQDIEDRKRAVFEREQIAATRERWLLTMGGLRRCAYAWSPRWLIASKRKVFGTTVPKVRVH